MILSDVVVIATTYYNQLHKLLYFFNILYWRNMMMMMMMVALYSNGPSISLQWKLAVIMRTKDDLHSIAHLDNSFWRFGTALFVAWLSRVYFSLLTKSVTTSFITSTYWSTVFGRSMCLPMAVRHVDHSSAFELKFMKIKTLY